MPCSICGRKQSQGSTAPHAASHLPISSGLGQTAQHVLVRCRKSKGAAGGRMPKRSTGTSHVGPWKKHIIWSRCDHWNHLLMNYIPILYYTVIYSLDKHTCSVPWCGSPFSHFFFRYKMHPILLYWLYSSASDERITTQVCRAKYGEGRPRPWPSPAWHVLVGSNLPGWKREVKWSETCETCETTINMINEVCKFL